MRFHETGGDPELGLDEPPIEPHDSAATRGSSDEHVIGVSRISAKRGDRTLDMSEVEVFHMTPEGKIVDFWGIAEDEDVLAAFWVD